MLDTLNLDHIRANGGGTYTFGHVPTDGFYVAGIEPATKINAEDLDNVTLVRTVFGILNHHTFAGVWIDQHGTAWIEPSEWFPFYSEAYATAVEREEIALWDIVEDSEIRIID